MHLKVRLSFAKNRRGDYQIGVDDCILYTCSLCYQLSKRRLAVVARCVASNLFGAFSQHEAPTVSLQRNG